jgi:CspA family cold shock protein
MSRGIVKWFNAEKGFGFIDVVEDGVELSAFVHFSDIYMEGYKKLDDGDEVEFELEKTNQGFRAINVVKV